MQNPYSKLTHFVENLNYFRNNYTASCVNCHSTQSIIYQDKYENNYCDQCAKQIQIKKHGQLKTRYHPILNKEQFNKIIQDFTLVYEKNK
jgi:hypothetical protein